MSATDHRGVTRGYLAGLIFAVVVSAFSLLLLCWALISLITGGVLISTPDVGIGGAAVMTLLCIGGLVWGLWSQSLVLLRGRRSLSLPHLLSTVFGCYLLWCVLGVALGLRIADTWLSPYALALACCWLLAGLLCWALLARRRFTELSTPQWPWERRGEPGPDWVGGELPWGSFGRRGSDEDDPATDDWRER